VQGWEGGENGRGTRGGEFLEVDDDHPTVVVVTPRRRVVVGSHHRDRKFELWLLIPMPLLVFAASDLFDDERRQHQKHLPGALWHAPARRQVEEGSTNGKISARTIAIKLG